MSTATSTGSGDLRGTWLVLAMTSICMTIVAYNTTAVITIMPDLKSDFDLGSTALQWVMAIYTVSGATLVPILGRLSDIKGKMKIFLFGMAVFAVGSLTVALAPSGAILLVGRCVQGMGAAALFGTSLAVLNAATPESHRAFVTGIWSAMIGLGMSLGPIIGGAFAEFLDWRGIFVADLILLAIAFVLSLRIIKHGYVPHHPMAGAKLDYVGTVAIVLLLGPLSFALSNGEDDGWTSPLTLVPLLVALVATVALLIAERRIADPLVELRFFQHPRYVMAVVGIFVAGFLLFCFFVFFNLFLQSPDALGMSAVQAGAAVLPFSGTMFVLSVIVPRVLAPYSFRWPITIGMALMALGFFLLTTTTNDTAYGDLWWKLVILGLGLGLTFPLLPRVGLRLLPEELAGQGSGVINTCLYFGATVGSVVGGVAVGITVRANLSGVIAALPAGSTQRSELAADLAHGSPSQVQALLAELDPATSEALAAALRMVQDDALNGAMLVGAIVALIGAVLAAWLLRGAVPKPFTVADLT